MNLNKHGDASGAIAASVNPEVDEKTMSEAPETLESQVLHSGVADELMQTMALGERLVAYLASAFNLAGLEARLALQTLPKLVLIWLLMAPIILLVWCSFSVLIAWCVFALSAQLGLSLLSFFVLQIVLLLGCRWLYGHYCARMTLPNTRAQINDLIRSVEDEFSHRREAKKQ